MTFVSRGLIVSPPVLRSGAGEALQGTLHLTADIAAAALRAALRAPLVAETDGDGPAYDALDLIGAELELPRHPEETWETYRARLAGVWGTAPLWGADIPAQLAAAGLPGAVIKTPVDWPLMGVPGYWSQFWVWFPLAYHSVVSDEPQVTTTETGGFITHYAEGITLAQYRTINSVIARFKPAHWLNRGVKFEWEPARIASIEDAGLIVESGGAVTDIGLFTQSTPSLRPTWSDPYAVADGTEWLTTSDAGLLAAAEAATVSFAARVQRVGTGSVQIFLGFKDAGGVELTLGWDAADKLALTRDGTTITAAGADDGLPHVVIAVITGSTAVVYSDNVVAISGTVGAGALTLTQGQVFANGDDLQASDAKLSALSVYSAALTPTQRQQLTDFYTDATDFNQYPGWGLLEPNQVISTYTAGVGVHSHPAGAVGSVRVQAWGNGGGGGKDIAEGGGGAYAEDSFLLTAGAEYDHDVGATPAVDTDGADVSFGGGLVVAKGGKSGTNGGSGGLAAECTGAIVWDGGHSSGLGIGTAGAGSEGPGIDNTAGPPDGGVQSRVLGGGGQGDASDGLEGGRGMLSLTYNVMTPLAYPLQLGNFILRDIETAVGPHPVPLPAKISGHRVTLIVAADGVPVLTIADGAWTKVGQQDADSPAMHTLAVFSAAMTADTASVSISSDVSTRITVRGFVDRYAALPTATFATGNSQTPDPPAHDAGSVAPRLWRTAFSIDGAARLRAVTGPVGWANLQLCPAKGGGSSHMATAATTETAQTVNPGTFVASSTGARWVTVTIGSALG